ncbi:MAG: hypothetical protein KJ904_16730 [Alphaproteobacteria bacterium]|nr:hypothetical protein [Alphaproteobacteria bacterium]MBU0799169.1 hypothetical protein [Alphaproteobacteria bacterium]MBU0888802.1 hypothetical protein [Alphaproteobacteria bacterium]MBU1812479.1 hypothetical protein [Alphaproteobacteria bacterium]
MDVAAFADNLETRCPVVLVLDTSASMDGPAIAELNDGLAAFQAEVADDPLARLRLDLAIVTCGGGIGVAKSFSPIEDFVPPLLEAAGDTPLGGALLVALDMLEARKRLYREAGVPYHRPWLFLISDGAPTDGELWREAAAAILAGETGRKLSFFAIGVGGADFALLAQISPPSRPPLKLQGVRFGALFRWLSSSMRRLSTARIDPDHLELPPVDGWAAPRP